MIRLHFLFFFFFFNDTATTEIYTLSLHDALPIFFREFKWSGGANTFVQVTFPGIFPDLTRYQAEADQDRKSTRLNSSHLGISYAVFCLKKKRIQKTEARNSPHYGVCDQVLQQVRP